VPPQSKAEAGRRALEVRSEIGLGPFEPLDPRVLAREYGIPIFTVTGLSSCPRETVAHLTGGGQGAFSAALVPLGTCLFIVENDAHTDARRRASLAHEMAHVVWEHRFTEVLVNEDGCRAADPDAEEEADRLGNELLVPNRAAVAAAKNGWADEEVAQTYGVSVPYARMRMNRSGARKIVQRAAARHSGVG